MKLIHVLASSPMSKLTGVIQVDETFVRGAQKGPRDFVSHIDKTDIRETRYGYRSSKYSVMGTEFTTVTTVMDNGRYCVCKVTDLGKLTNDIFINLFKDNLDKPTYTYTDSNDFYENYCRLFNNPHYVKLFNYNKIITNNSHRIPNYRRLVAAEVTGLKNSNTLERLYYQEVIDKMTKKGPTSYKEFNQFKKLRAFL